MKELTLNPAMYNNDSYAQLPVRSRLAYIALQGLIDDENKCTIDIPVMAEQIFRGEYEEDSRMAEHYLREAINDICNAGLASFEGTLTVYPITDNH